MIPVYEAVFKEGQNGVYALSVVEDPAMEDLWIAFNKHPQTMEFASVDEDKRLLLGAALIPNKRIYRKDESTGDEFYVTFSEETIVKLAHNFMQEQNNNNSSLEHETKIDGVSVVEAWIVEDPEKDKSAAFGKQYEKGTWVTMMKVDNDEIWTKVKNKEINGFSIDALLGMQQINLNKMTEDKKDSVIKEFINDIKAFFSSEEQSEQQEEQQSESQEEAVEETQEQPFDAEAFVSGLKEQLNAEFSTQIKALKDANDSKLAEKDAKIEELQLALSKKPEPETTKITPETANEKKSVKLNNNVRPTTSSRAKHNIAEAMGW